MTLLESQLSREVSDPGKEMAVPLGAPQKLVLKCNWYCDRLKRWDLKEVNRSWDY